MTHEQEKKIAEEAGLRVITKAQLYLPIGISFAGILCSIVTGAVFLLRQNDSIDTLAKTQESLSTRVDDLRLDLAGVKSVNDRQDAGAAILSQTLAKLAATSERTADQVGNLNVQVGVLLDRSKNPPNP
jgi:hypothetical protein